MIKKKRRMTKVQREITRDFIQKYFTPALRREALKLDVTRSKRLQAGRKAKARTPV